MSESFSGRDRANHIEKKRCCVLRTASDGIGARKIYAPRRCTTQSASALLRARIAKIGKISGWRGGWARGGQIWSDACFIGLDKRRELQVSAMSIKNLWKGEKPVQFAVACVRPSVLRVGTIFHSYNLINCHRRCVYGGIEFMEKCSDALAP